MTVSLAYLKARVEPAANGCWLWTRSLTDGYGVVGFRENGRNLTRRAHRLMYELLVGPIPEGLQLDHLCRNRRCINPAHLEPVTNRENTLRGVAGEVARQRYAQRTHCSQGHELTDENTRVNRRGHRICRACCREYARIAYGRTKHPCPEED